MTGWGLALVVIAVAAVTLLQLTTPIRARCQQARACWVREPHL